MRCGSKGTEGDGTNKKQQEIMMYNEKKKWAFEPPPTREWEL